MSFFAAFIHRQLIHWPAEPTASFEGQTVIVTGANSGLGKEACRLLLRHGVARVVLACRSLERGRAAARELEAELSITASGSGGPPAPARLDVWELDAASTESIVAFARRAETELDRLDAVIANAGVRELAFRTTADGDERTIATNVLGPVLLCALLHAQLRATAARAAGTQTHFTVVGSELYEVAKFKELAAPEATSGSLFDVLNDPRASNMMDRYNISKLLMMAAVREMSAAAPVADSGVVINCVAPGFCQSELGHSSMGWIVYAISSAFKRLLARPTAVGARTLVYGAAAGRETHGGYLPDCELTEVRGLLRGEEGMRLQKRIWEGLHAKMQAAAPGVALPFWHETGSSKA
ncbi:hypothetical protein HK405_003258 [Cladochytrium tenue]|nr:hypothetical protein HK405_003258 [Cladochytrium tenue]